MIHLHMFTRYVYDDVKIGGHELSRGDQVALMIGASGRDPKRWEDPNRFDPRERCKKIMRLVRASTFALVRRWPAWKCKSH